MLKHYHRGSLNLESLYTCLPRSSSECNEYRCFQWALPSLCSRGRENLIIQWHWHTGATRGHILPNTSEGSATKAIRKYASKLFLPEQQYLQVGLHRQAGLRQLSQATVPRKVWRSFKTQQLSYDNHARWQPLQPSLFVKSKPFHLLPHLQSTIIT